MLPIATASPRASFRTIDKKEVPQTGSDWSPLLEIPPLLEPPRPAFFHQKHFRFEPEYKVHQQRPISIEEPPIPEPQLCRLLSWTLPTFYQHPVKVLSLLLRCRKIAEDACKLK